MLKEKRKEKRERKKVREREGAKEERIYETRTSQLRKERIGFASKYIYISSSSSSS